MAASMTSIPSSSSSCSSTPVTPQHRANSRSTVRATMKASKESCTTSISSSSSSSSSNSSSISSCNSSISSIVHHWKPSVATEATAKQRRVAFSRSRSLSECRQTGGRRDGSTEGGGETPSRFCQFRSFKSTRKGLIRSGESYKSMDTKTFMSTGSVRVYRKLNTLGRSESIDSTDSSVGGSSVAESYYRVCVLGATGVGKSTLIRKFLTSEEKTDLSTSPAAGQGATSQVVTVSVSLDGQESLLEFWDRSQDEVIGAVHKSLESSTATLTSVSQLGDDDDEVDDVFDVGLSQSDAYTVVFALNDLESFRLAESFLRHLREEMGTDRAITVVGNKSDLVRQRHVWDKEACALAHRYDCKYIETSAVLGHQTDELLVGTLRQIRLKLSTSREDMALDDVRPTNRRYQRWQRIVHLYRFLHGASQGDSCQNFFV